MSSQYVSSIATKYGDLDQVKTDVKTLREILSRQGSSLLIDVIAETTGEAANKFSMSFTERAKVHVALVEELDESLKERV